MEIIDGSNKPKKKVNKKLLVTCVIGVAVVAAIAFGVYSIFVAKNYEPQPEQDKVYQDIRDSYKEKNIDYSYDDYKKDKEILDKSNGNPSEEEKANLSGSYHKAMSSDEKAVNDANELTGVKDQTPDTVKSYILTKVDDMSTFIESNYGWSSYDDENYASFKEYITNLDKYACYGTSMDNWYEDYTLDYQANILRYSAYTQQQYSLSLNTSGNDIVLKQWYLAGHPRFSKIYSFTLENNDVELDENNISNLQARVVTDNGSYIVYLKAYITDSSSYYELIDIKQL